MQLKRLLYISKRSVENRKQKKVSIIFLLDCPAYRYNIFEAGIVELGNAKNVIHVVVSCLLSDNPQIISILFVNGIRMRHLMKVN